MSNIEWTDETWNPVIGCTPVSPGCLNCYAATMARRLEAMGKPEYAPREVPMTASELRAQHESVGGGKLHDHERVKEIRIAEVRGGRAVFTGDVRCIDDRLTLPLKWKKPRMVFVNSMSDLFHGGIYGQEHDDDRWIEGKFNQPGFDFLMGVANTIRKTPQHTYQILTKRPRIMVDMWPRALRKLNISTPLPNVWLGTSVENQKAADERIPHLLKCPAAVRFLSVEPMLERVWLDCWPPQAGIEMVPLPDVWEDVSWPDWVPEALRTTVAKDYQSRREGPRCWWDRATSKYSRGSGRPVPQHPPMGAFVGVNRRGWVVPAAHPDCASVGRYVPRWGNMGTVVTDTGECVHAASSQGPGWLSRHLNDNGDYQHLLHWVILGCESGKGARPCDISHLRSVVKQCADAGVPCFVKQWGSNCGYTTATGEWIKGWANKSADECGYTNVRRLRDPKGGDPSEWPPDLRVRQMPGVNRG